MPTLPLRPQLQSYRGGKQALQLKNAEANALAQRIVDHVNGLIARDDVGPESSARIDPERRGGVRQALLDRTKGRDDLRVILMEPPAFWLNPCGLGIVCKQSPG